VASEPSRDLFDNCYAQPDSYQQPEKLQGCLSCTKGILDADPQNTKIEDMGNDAKAKCRNLFKACTDPLGQCIESAAVNAEEE